MWVTTCLGVGLLVAVHAQSQPNVNAVYPDKYYHQLPDGEQLVYGLLQRLKPSSTRVRDFYADPNDCQTFYRRVDVGISPLRLECPVGSVFEETLSACVDPSRSTRPKCRPTTLTDVHEAIPTPTAEPSNPEILTPESTSSVQIIANPQPLTSNPHPTVQTKIADPVVNGLQKVEVITCSGPGRFAVVGDCAAFYSCVGDNPLPSFSTCHEGKVFDGSDCVNPQQSSRLECRKEVPYKAIRQPLPVVDRPKTDVRLDPRSNYVTLNPTTPVEKNSLLTWETGRYYSPDFIADDANCHIYYRITAEDATPVRFICPVRTVFEETLSVCVEPARSTRAECRDTSDPIQRGFQEYVADENNCFIYYRNLANGQVMEFECPVGTVFEERLSSCVHPFVSTRPDCRISSVEQSFGRQLFRQKLTTADSL